MSSATLEKRISPSEYLSLAVSISSDSVPDRGAVSDSTSLRIIVVGDVNLHSYADRDLVRILPQAEIRGSVKANHCHTLEFVECSISGSGNFDASGVREFGSSFKVGATLDARGCKNLKTLTGDFPSVVALEDSAIELLDKDFICRSDLFVGRCSDLQSLNCRVEGSLHAEGSALARVGKNFYCGGDLRLGGCRNLNVLGAVSGPPRDVLAPHSGIAEVRPGFFCTGSLVLKKMEHLRSLAGCALHRVEVEEAPQLRKIDALRSKGNMEFSLCPALTKVDFFAGGEARFYQCGMAEFSPSSKSFGLNIRDCDNFRHLGGRWDADVNLVGLRSFRETLPSFACTGNLMMRDCGDFLDLAGRVGGRVALSKLGSLEEVGSNFSVGGDLVLGCSESKLRSLGCSVGGNLIVSNCHLPFSTSAQLRVEGDATFQDCDGMERLRGRVGRTVRIKDGTGVRFIGADFECGEHLVIMGCRNLETINCRVAGNVLLKNSSLRRTGPAFRCEGRLTIEGSSGLQELRGSVGEDFVFFSETQRLEDVAVEWESTPHADPPRQKPSPSQPLAQARPPSRSKNRPLGPSLLG
jgi:hypothetical protein